MVLQYFKEEILESLGNTVLKSVQCGWEVQDEDSTWLTLFDNQKATDDFNQGNFSGVTGVTGSDRERSPVIVGQKAKGRCGGTAVGVASKLDMFVSRRKETGQKPGDIHVKQRFSYLLT